MNHSKKILLRPHLWLIALLGLIVPRRLRSDWRQEWEAEIQRREALLDEWDRLDWRSKLDLLRRSTSAFWDALWLQPQRMEDEMMQDFRFAVRMLRKQPGFTLFAVLTLALGVGATVTIFSALNAVLLRDLPFAAPERLMAVGSTKAMDRSVFDTLSYPDFADYKAQNQVFERLAAYQVRSFTLMRDEGAIRLRGAVASADLFPLLGGGPLYGRSFMPAEDEPGGGRAVMLSHRLWRDRFGSDPLVIGKTAQVNGASFTIVGVTPPEFSFPIQAESVELWVNFAVDRTGPQSVSAARGNHYLKAIGRLKPDINARQAESHLVGIAARLEREFQNENHEFSVRVTPLLEQMTSESRRSLWILTAAVGLMLLIACANISGLLLARALTRRREISLRAALGATAGRLFRQMLTESLLLSLLGGVCGVLLAKLGVKLLLALTPHDIPRLSETRLDGRALLFTLAVVVLTGVIMGLAPAWQSLRLDLRSSLSDGGRSASGRRSMTRDTLVVAQTAVALVLLIGAGLLIQSFARLQSVHHGFDPGRLQSTRVTVPTGVYTRPVDIAGFHQRVMEKLEGLPGVSAFSSVTPLPMTGSEINLGFNIEGRPDPSGRDYPYQTRLFLIGADYFQTMGVPLQQGREFTARDDLYARPVAIINEAFARKYFPDQNPIGKRINPAISADDRPLPMREIIAVAANTRSKTLSEAPFPEVYLHLPQCPATGSFSLVFRTSLESQLLASSARTAVAAVDRNAPITQIRAFDEYFVETMRLPRFHALLIGAFAGLALLLAAIGLYGIMAFAVSQRTAEIGVRLALGARGVDVLRLILAQGMKLVLVGLAFGATGALVFTQWLKTLLFGVTATDPTIFLAAAGLLVLACLAACWIPARRATRVDPLVALNCE